MNRVLTREVKLENYAGVVSEELLAEVTRAAERLRGLHVVHVNAIPAGGGVAD